MPMKKSNKSDKPYTEITDRARLWRRDLHRNPELSFQEFQTTSYIEQEIKAIGLSYRRVSPTGLVAFIPGNGKHSKAIALRADIDALPIQEDETSKKEYLSQNPGVMHACGHDYHTANLLGVATVLAQRQAQLEGNVVLIFQAGEERAPGGAKSIVDSGILQEYQVQTVVGLHVSPDLPVGQIGFRPGIMMASADELYLRIKGRGGHGAQPQTTIDPVAITAQLLVSLQQIVSRQADPRIPSVLTFGKVQANGSTNVIPESVYLEGTFRTTDEGWRTQALTQIKKMSEELVRAMGGVAELEIKSGYPALQNDPQITQQVKQCALELFGSQAVLDVPIWMASEDFAYYAQTFPSTFFLVGTRDESKGITSDLHTASFDLDESILQYSIPLLVNYTQNVLQDWNNQYSGS